ncbi:MAG: hypothetical protein Q7R62_02970, partial [bacterium]|nr:hypothetical protein [bacterium]
IGAAFGLFRGVKNAEQLTAAGTKKSFKQGAGEFLGSIGRGIKGGAATATGHGATANLYGRATELLSRGAAHLSFIPGMTSAASLLAKTSAAQGDAVHRAEQETEGMSPAAIRAWIASAAWKDSAHQAAAMALADKNHMQDAIPSGSLKSFADSVAAFQRGVKREKIDLLKAFSDHNPFDSKGISGEDTAEVFRRLDGNAIRDLDMDHWKPEQIRSALELMTDSAKRTYASKNSGTQAEMLAHAVSRLETSFSKFDATKADEAAMLTDFRASISGNRDRSLMDRIEGHFEKLNDKSKEALRDSFDVGARAAVSFGRDVARTTISTKSKSEHAASGYADYGLGALLARGARAAIGSAKGGGGKRSSPPASHGGGGKHT